MQFAAFVDKRKWRNCNQLCQLLEALDTLSSNVGFKNDAHQLGNIKIKESDVWAIFLLPNVLPEGFLSSISLVHCESIEQIWIAEVYETEATKVLVRHVEIESRVQKSVD